jgi:hypothetical protein
LNPSSGGSLVPSPSLLQNLSALAYSPLVIGDRKKYFFKAKEGPPMKKIYFLHPKGKKKEISPSKGGLAPDPPLSNQVG